MPKVLRQFFRNQGGVNSVVLEAVERLIEVNRNLRRQNYELHERMMDLHSWAHTVVEVSAENRGWMLVADARLRPSGEGRFAHIEERLARLEERGGQDAGTAPAILPNPQPPVEVPLAELAARTEALEAEKLRLAEDVNRLQIQANEQAAYIRSVHGHLDQLGAHVESGFNRLQGNG